MGVILIRVSESDRGVILLKRPAIPDEIARAVAFKE